MKWISVKDRLPKNGIEVLVWEEGCDNPFIGYYRYASKLWYVDIEHYTVDGDGVIKDNIWQGDITHWMPLPKRPKYK